MNKHARRHAAGRAPAHEIARSLEPGEKWLCCFTDQALVGAGQ
jgi:hypothetical protein